MQHVYHHCLMNIDKLMISRKIVDFVNSFIVESQDRVTSLKLNLLLRWLMNARRSFFLQILSLVRRHLTDSAVLIALDINYKYLLFAIANKFDDNWITLSIFIVNTAQRESVSWDNIFDDCHESAMFLSRSKNTHASTCTIKIDVISLI